MTRVMHVASSVSNPAAGTDHAVLGLCAALAARGSAVQLHSLRPDPLAKPKEFLVHGYDQWAMRTKLGFSFTMRQGLLSAADEVDLIHGHSLWVMPNVYAAIAARRSNRPYVFSVHGMFAPAAMTRSRLKKALFMRLWQSKALDAVDCFHATSQEEYLDIRRLGYRAPVCIQPFGMAMPELQRIDPPARRTLLFLGRLDPIKRIDLLLTAWRGIQDANPDWDLVICGPDSVGHSKDLQKLAERLGVSRMEFAGPKYGEEKAQLFARADLFVLPSETENFGFVVAEALAHGVPAIVSKGAPWSGLAEHDCGWWIAGDLESLEDCLRRVLVLDRETLVTMGARGREWMQREFSWARVAERMEATYRWLIGNAAKPDWVVLD